MIRDKRLGSSRVRGSLSLTQPFCSNTPDTNIWPLWPAFLMLLLTLTKLHSSACVWGGGSWFTRILQGASPATRSRGCPRKYTHSVPECPCRSTHSWPLMTTTIWMLICQMPYIPYEIHTYLFKAICS